MRLRVLVHALDRTGPPNLAIGLLEWLMEQVPTVEVDVVAFRGGPLEHEVADLGIPVTVLMRQSEPWDHENPPAARVKELRTMLLAEPNADATLVVSVAAGQVLPLLAPNGPVITWVLERGEDLHWIDGHVELRERTTKWLAGATATAVELAERLGSSPVPVVPEFIANPKRHTSEEIAEARLRWARPDQPLVMGAGIATHRKAPDLFLEVALRAFRNGSAGTRFVWIGGEADPLFQPLIEQAQNLGLGERLVLHPGVANFEVALAGADLLVHPARLDAFPLVCLHAAALGVPVLGFAGRSALEEMFGEDAAVLPYPDVGAVAEKVTTMIKNDSERHMLGALQQARVLERYVASEASPKLWEAIQTEVLAHERGVGS